MKKILVFAFIAAVAMSCNQPDNKPSATANADFAKFLDNYYEGRMKMLPLEATFNGDNRYNDVLFIDISEGERQRQKDFFTAELDSLKKFDYDKLGDNDKLSYDVLNRDLSMAIEGFDFKDNYMPFNQFTGLPLMFGQLGSGSSMQPFKTIQDYDNWLKRVDAFAVWMDTAIVYFKKGMDANIVLPKSLVVKMIPQMEDIVVTDPTKSLFYGPVKLMPASFSDSDKQHITDAYVKAINEKIVPSYKKLGEFLKNEYLPKARTTTGISGIPEGDKYYVYLVKLLTTTNKTPDEIYNTGLAEVKRIREEMEKVKEQVGFKGDLKAFFEYMKTDKQFMPYKTPDDVLNAYHKIHETMKPQLKKMFNDTPTIKFEVRQTEAFRAASASAEYNQGTPDGSRPGIFYVPIVDATKYNTTSGMESLFLHEAIPGHHYQISLAQENTSLPKFRRFGGNNAYVEGWALYCESLGKELGLYTDPYQYMGALGDEIHRAIRLVVDVGMHTKNMTREEAIKYMMDNEPLAEAGTIAEIERYMAIPGQALGYKIGALKIRELRTKYEKQLGPKFSVAEFHDQVLKDGALPLEVFEKKMDKWAEEKAK